MESRITVDHQRCAHETVESETMVIDTASGHLVLLTGIGPVLWEVLCNGTTRSSLLGEIGARYGAAAREEAVRFLDELMASGLVIIDNAADAPTTTGTVRAEAPTVAHWPPAFSAPVLERYEEIADIMAMDPIHEVDQTQGWPHANPGPQQ